MTNSNYPSSIKDTEKIFIEILKSKATYTVNGVKDKRLELPKPSPRYITLLKEKTEKIREVTPNSHYIVL